MKGIDEKKREEKRVVMYPSLPTLEPILIHTLFD
jgi:hypothetical protein